MAVLSSLGQLVFNKNNQINFLELFTQRLETKKSTRKIEVPKSLTDH